MARRSSADDQLRRYSRDQRRNLVLQRVRKRRGGHDVGDRETSAGLQDPERLSECSPFVGDQVDDAVREDDVCARVGDRKVLYLSQAKLHAFDVRAAGILPRLGHHARRHVDADHLARRTDLPCGQKAVEASAATEVNDRIASLKVRDRLRVAAAAEPQVGARRQRGQILLRIPEPQARLWTRTAAARSAPGLLKLGHLAVVLAHGRSDLLSV